MDTTRDISAVSLPNTIPSVIADGVPSKKTIIKSAEKIISSKDPLEYIEKAGINLVSLYKQLNTIATSANLYAKDRDGEAIELGPDNKARISAIALLLELAKHIKDKNVVIQTGIFNDPKIVEETNRVLALRNRVS